MNYRQKRQHDAQRPTPGPKAVVFAALLLTAGGSTSSFAQAPLDIAALLAERSQLTMQVGYRFQSAEDFVLISLPPQNSVPAQLSSRTTVERLRIEQEIESQQLITALRYGVNSDIEFRSTFRQGETRVRSILHPASSQRSSALALGATWRISHDDRTPALLLAIDLDAATRSPLQDSQIGYGKAVRVNALTYRSLDPLVLSLRAGIEHRSQWQRGELEFDPGDSASLATQVSFAVNPEVTLIGGVRLQLFEPAKLADIELESRRSRITVNVATGIALSQRSSIFLSSDIAASGRREASINIEWLYQFEL